MLMLLPHLGLSIHPAEIGLPPHGNHAGKDAAVLERDKGEAESRGGGPHLDGVDEAHGDGGLAALNGGCDGLAGQEGLGGEEVDVEGGGEDGEVDGDLCADGEPARGVVEVVREEDVPLPVGDGGDASDDEAAHRPLRRVGVAVAHVLRR